MLFSGIYYGFVWCCSLTAMYSRYLDYCRVVSCWSSMYYLFNPCRKERVSKLNERSWIIHMFNINPCLWQACFDNGQWNCSNLGPWYIHKEKDIEWCTDCWNSAGAVFEFKILKLNVDFSVVMFDTMCTNLWNILVKYSYHFQVFFLPLSNTIISSFKDDSIFAWDFESLVCKYQLPIPDGPAPHYRAFATPRDGRLLAAGGRSGLYFK